MNMPQRFLAFIRDFLGTGNHTGNEKARDRLGCGLARIGLDYPVAYAPVRETVPETTIFGLVPKGRGAATLQGGQP